MSLLPFRGRCHTCGHDHDAEDSRLRDVLDICKQAGQEELREENARLRRELRAIAEAKRFDRSVFETDTEFADWAQSRCRYQIRGDAAADAAAKAPHIKTAAEMRYDAAHDTSCVGAFARARP